MSEMLGLGITFSGMLRYRRFRRLTAIIAQLLIVQLAAVSGLAVCPYGDGPASDAAPAAAMADHAGHEMMTGASPAGNTATTASHNADAPPQHQHHTGAHCDMACAPSSCGSAGHCSGTASTQAARAGQARLAADLVAATVRDMPSSVSTAPEPPPPRA